MEQSHDILTLDEAAAYPQINRETDAFELATVNRKLARLR